VQPSEIAQQAYAAFGNGDMPGLGALLAADTVWHINDVKPLNGDKHGVDEVFQFLGKLMEISGGTFAIKVNEFMGNDSHASMLIEETAQRDGKSLKAAAVHVMRMVDGKVAEFWASSPDPANEAFWS
jgi:ketosteroid isomerase-like protein